MSMPFIANTPGFESDSWAMSPDAVPLERSTLVAVCISLVVCGGLLASSADASLPGLLLALPLLALAVEEEVRRFEVPAWIGLTALGANLVWLGGGSGGTPAVLLALGSAVIMPALLLPLYGAGLVRLGALITSAALGAIWGIDPLPAIILWAVALGLPFALLRISLRGNPRTLPILTAIGLAASMHQLFG